MKKILLMGFVFFLVGCGQDTPQVPPSQDTSGEDKVQVDIPVQDVQTGVTQTGEDKVSVTPRVPESSLSVSSPIQHESFFPIRYTCKGEDISPPFDIAGVPEGTESLLFIMSSDESQEGKFVHWSVWNIDPSTVSVAEDSVPGSMEGINGFETIGYQGPCPEDNQSKVLFEVWALDKKLGGSSQWTAGHLLINAMDSILGKASFEMVLE